jgi:hypothetical protein
MQNPVWSENAAQLTVVSGVKRATFRGGMISPQSNPPDNP